MTWIFEQLVEWLTDSLGDFFSLFSAEILTLFSLDKTYFDSNVPYITNISTIITGLGLGIAVVILICALAKNMLGEFSDSYESPLRLIGGFFVSCICVVFGKSIVDLEFNMFADAYIRLMSVGDNSAGFSDMSGLHVSGTSTALLAGDVLTGGINPVDQVAAAATGLSGLILIIALAIEWFKLLTEAVQRYIVIMLCFYFSPLAFATAVSKESTRIFKAFIKLVFSQLLLMLMNVIFLKAVSSAMNMMSGNVHPILGIIFIISLAQIGQKIDSYFKALGLDIVQTGTGLASAILGGSATVFAVAKTAGAVKGIATGTLAKWGAGQGLANLVPGLQGMAMNTASGAKGFANASNTANNVARAMADDTLANQVANGNVDGSAIADLMNGKKVGNSKLEDMTGTLFNENNGLENLQKACADSEENPFDKIPDLENANINIGNGRASAVMPNGAEVDMRKLRAGENAPQNATLFDIGGEKWMAQPKFEKHEPINSNPKVANGETTSFDNAFGPQAKAMQAATNGASSVTKVANGVYRASDGTVFASTFGENGELVKGGTAVTGENMMDSYSAFTEADVMNTPFAQDGYCDDIGISNNYIDSRANGTFNSAMRDLGQRDDSYNITEIAHGDDSTFSFRTSTGGDFTCYDASQYTSSDPRTPMVEFDGGKYYVGKTANANSFSARGSSTTYSNNVFMAGEGGINETHIVKQTLPNGKTFVRENSAR
ncbi:MAG: hypothetical protein K6B67_05465 [Lachnospiraceae bacterium]|nr:hypothetical protein [Lachnospiraceae bacterium]